MRGMLTMLAVVALALPLRADDKDNDLTPERRQELEKKAAALNAEGLRQYRAGSYVKAKEVLHEALDLYRALYPPKDYPKGHPGLATSINNLVALYQAAGEYGK